MSAGKDLTALRTAAGEKAVVAEGEPAEGERSKEGEGGTGRQRGQNK